MTGDPWVDPEFDRKVRETAFFLWEAAGKPFGQEQEFWFIALERTLRERDADIRLKDKPPPRPSD
ncbi:hypothetical protein WH87_04620 [Devosia epidermidihirudinis]|uniref:DUF2934 domain-containing protein n=1 Tax=Devosia epidermidihirudinis TaxID=1293439 RepID=A0A0F5QFJ3_9HYPH|nr:DUF2934 domain-containing protein [Devosia epidermidihirudinis]KKC39488.1 hypothetical protein WH87_04620 [Devosia epidermidihirudinis]